MHEWAEKLLALQDVDQRIIRLKQQVESVPVEKEKNQAGLDDARNQVAVAKAKVQDCEKEIKTVAIDIEALEKKQRDFQAKTTMIKNNMEYKAALHQIDEIKDSVRKLEDKELELMEALENAKAEQVAAKKNMTAAEARIREMQNDLDKRAGAAGGETERLQEKREEYTAGIPVKNLQRYERLRSSPRYNDGLVFVPVQESTCGRCHMNITYQVRMDARKGMLVSCGNCGVLLYAEE